MPFTTKWTPIFCGTLLLGASQEKLKHVLQPLPPEDVTAHRIFVGDFEVEVVKFSAALGLSRVGRTYSYNGPVAL